MTTNLNGSNGIHAKTSWPEQEGVSDMTAGSEKHSPRVRHPRSAIGWRPERCDRIALIFQGGGALGAYQAGVYEALHEEGIEPDWVAGVSIGAINAAIIAGNSRAHRIEKLRDFWHRITERKVWH